MIQFETVFIEAVVNFDGIGGLTISETGHLPFMITAGISDFQFKGRESGVFHIFRLYRNTLHGTQNLVR